MAIVSVGIASICLDKDGHPLGGFLGLVRDTSPMLAKGYNIGINIDAEEADRLELSLDLLEALAMDADTAGFDGIGFVVSNGAIYVLGGANNTAGVQAGTFYTRPFASASVGAWSAATPLPLATHSPAVAVHDDPEVE